MKKINTPLVSYVIPILNAREYLDEFLKSYSKINYVNREVIIADDGSTDGSIECIESFFKKKSLKYTLIKNPKRLGIPKSRNLGIKNAKGKYIAFAETDMLFDPHYLSRLVAVCESNNNIGSVFGKIMDFQKKDIFQAAGAQLIPQTGWVVSRGFGEKDHGQYDHDIIPSLVTTVGSLVRKSALIKIGGLDEELGRLDDVEFGWRLWIAGYDNLFVPSAKVYHYTTKVMSKRKSYSVFMQQFDSGKNIKVIFQNYTFWYMLRYFPIAVGINILRIISRLLCRDIAGAYGILYAIFWFFQTLPASIKKRKKIRLLRRYSDTYIQEKIMVKKPFLRIYTENLLPIFSALKKMNV